VRLDEGVLQPHSLAKYAAAFFKMSRSRKLRDELKRVTEELGLLIIVLLTLLLRFAVELDPGVKAVNGHPQALGDLVIEL